MVANNHRGLSLENIRNLATIYDSHIVSNQYGAGLRVFGGAGLYIFTHLHLSILSPPLQ